VALLLAKIEQSKVQESNEEARRIASKKLRQKRVKYVWDYTEATVWYLEQVCRGPAVKPQQDEACERLMEADLRIAQDELAAASSKKC
jgi:hypothetical protein